MLAFIVQVSLLILASVLVGVLVGWVIRRHVYLGKLAQLQEEHVTLVAAVKRTRLSLDECEQRQREMLVPQAVAKPRSNVTVEPAATSEQSVFLKEPQGKADDLKRIRGVGEKLEKTLNGLGLFHYWQIAQLTPDDVAWIDQRLRFKGRIERDTWIAQARLLAQGEETGITQHVETQDN